MMLTKTKIQKVENRSTNNQVKRNWLREELFLKRFMKEKVNLRKNLITARRKRISILKKKIKR